MALTKSSTFLIGWIATLLGFIMDLLFKLTGLVGISNIGLCIILFTIVTNILLLPLTIKQQKSQKLMSIMQPELTAIQNKYKDKKDQQSQQRMQAETQAVYEKYGTSMTGGCVQLLIQFPILFALYAVIQRIPAYVPEIRVLYENVAQAITGGEFSGYTDKIADLASSVKMNAENINSMDTFIDFLYKLSPSQWEEIKEIFPHAVEVINENLVDINRLNSFLGINLAAAPFQGFRPNWAWLIPILAGLSQWYSAKVMTRNQPAPANNDPNSPASSLQTMNTVMPIMSVFFCFTFPAGIGIYWIASAVVRTVQQILIDRKLKDVSAEDLAKQNLEKINAKRAKKGLPPKTFDKQAVNKAKREEVIKERTEAAQAKNKERSDKMVAESTEYYAQHARKGSLASKAAMVNLYDQRMYEKKTGKKVSENKPSENKPETAAAETVEKEESGNE